jgi:hypothetical protein
LGAGEAAWRILGNDIYMMTHTVYRLPVHLKDRHNVILHDGDDLNDVLLMQRRTKLTEYFALNECDANARQYMYREIPLHYTFNQKYNEWRPRKRRADGTIARLYTVNYNNVELYCLRLLLLTVRGARSFEELRTVNGIAYDTNHQAAVALGLMEDDNLHEQTFREVASVQMPRQLRRLFANMLYFIKPMNPLALWQTFKHSLIEDYRRRNIRQDIAEKLALRHINVVLDEYNVSLKDYGLPDDIALDANDEQLIEGIQIDGDIDTVDVAAERQIGNDLAVQLTNEQRTIFDIVIGTVQNPSANNRNRLIYIDGPGGSGKTFLYSTIISTVLGMGRKVCVVAWTGIAASLLKGGRTVHSTFKLPLDMDADSRCSISLSSELAAIHTAYDVYIIDEISMMSKHAFDCIDIFLRQLMDKPNIPFGGKICLVGGDFRQCLPIVPNSTSRYNLFEHTVKASRTWHHFRKFTLTTNMRLNGGDATFAKWLLDVGNGALCDHQGNSYYSDYIRIPDECIISHRTVVQSVVQQVYGDSFTANDVVTKYANACIVTTLNEDVRLLNTLIYNRMIDDENGNTEKVYLSSDSSVEGEDAVDRMDITYLNELHPSGIPPHQLPLKVGCIVMLLRNLNPRDGFCNGTRLVIKTLYANSVIAEILSGNYKGKVIIIPKIRMTANVDGMTLVRVQLPLQVAFAMTINKAQGQSFETVGIYLRKPPFAHGQLYVALSRTRAKKSLFVQVLDDPLMGELKPNSHEIYVPNIVYKEVL